MSTRNDANRLAMSRRLQNLTGNWSSTRMATLYLESCTPDFQSLSAIRSLLVPSRNTALAIKTPGWHSVSRMPGPINRFDDGEEGVAYHRFGNDDGFEPLVLVRDFDDLKEPYVEISEEFRLFHNLYHDQERNTYLKIDDSGQETAVIELPSNCVKFRVNELRQYLAIREMHLLLQFDFHERSRHSLAELSLPDGETTHHDEQSNWRLHFTELDIGDHTGFARLIGKRLVPPVDKSRRRLSWLFPMLLSAT